MLRQVIIDNFALINRAEMDFTKGLNVITGESGAGKSLFIKALNIILGTRAETRLIGPFGKKSTIQALFEIDKEPKNFFKDRDIEFDGELILRRVISSDGRGKIFINGVLSTLSDLKQLTKDLIGIASQHEFHALLNKSAQRVMLDTYAEVCLENLKNIYNETKELKVKLNEFLKKKEHQQERKEELIEEVKLIDEISPQEGEEERLLEEKQLLKSTEKLRALGTQTYKILYEERGNIIEKLSECRGLLDRLSGLDQSLEPLSKQISSVEIELNDISSQLRDYLFDLPVDDSKLRQVEERLYKIRQLKRRFGPTIKDVLNYRENLEQELKEIDELDDLIISISKELKKKEERLLKEAITIRKKREKAASILSDKIRKELFDLNLKTSKFEIRLKGPKEPLPEDVTPYGTEEIEFYFSANPGRPLEPISKIASGGELSRILLAIKVVLGQKSGNETIVFDEIDTGLGGEIAEKVGKKLKEISKNSQVIAITHFPQIASLADKHIQVKKIQKENQIQSEFKVLSLDERLDELVRMLGEERESARKYAQEMLGPLFRRS